MDEITREKFMNDLLRKRTLYLEGELIHRDAREIGESILWLNAVDDLKEITLYINSSGGSVTAGLDIYDIIRNSNAPVTGIVYRSANSMATVVLQACKIRKALKHSGIVIHNIKINKEWHEFEENLEKALADTKRDQESIYEIFVKRTGRSLEEIKRACRETKTMLADEAKKFGLIDEVI